MSDGGKGSAPRPYSVSKEIFDTNWINIFRKDPKNVDDAIAEDEEFKRIEETNEKNTNNGK
jgi:hypothetical protein